MIFDFYVTVRKWRPNFDPKTKAIEDVLVWVRFPDLPLEYYEEDILEAMGNKVGYTVKVDMSTSIQSRGGYVRVGVQVDLRKPLLPAYIIDKKERPIVYEGLHLLCYRCGMGILNGNVRRKGGYKGSFRILVKGRKVCMEHGPLCRGIGGLGEGLERLKGGEQKQGAAGSRYANLTDLEDEIQGNVAVQGPLETVAFPTKEWVKRKGKVSARKNKNGEEVIIKADSIPFYCETSA